ncbi:hypothetical protein ACYSNR_04375 [Enterococcus sp. LJL128]|uniref:hypothetical protein n=1 Tax=Enterococcus sp. LJL51 TaxID=3416656 RepID=UPI003CF53631
MYAVKVFHGYICHDGHRTRNKEAARVFQDISQAEKFAKTIGGRVKELVNTVEKSNVQESISNKS